MAEENFLVQWDDRFMSVIKRKQIVSPVKDGYREGDLIRAVFEKKVYEAVTCEMHPNKRHLLQQAKLPPKFEYVEAKKQQSDTVIHNCIPSAPLRSEDYQVVVPGRDCKFRWEDEGSILRKKIKRLDSRITAVEAVLKNGNPKSEDEYALDLVKHLDNEQDVVSSLAKHIFTENELINYSRTGTNTVKCRVSPRPPLDQHKLERLQRLALQKTGMKKDLFIKKFENLQKVLCRSKKDMRKMSEAESYKI